MAAGGDGITRGRFLLLVFLTLCGLAGGFLARRDPNIMEARNLLCARDLLRGGDWLFPRLNGEVRLQKPPLPTWLSASACLLLGSGKGIPEDDTVMRFPAFLASLAGAWILYLMARDWGGGRAGGVLAAAALATSWAYLQWGVLATWDVYAFVFALGGVYALERAFGDGSGRGWAWTAGAALLFGLSGWSKGPVAFFSLVLPFLSASLLLSESRTRIRWGRLGAALAAGILLGSVWWILAWSAFGGAEAAFREETYAWGNRHVQPFYYYFAGLPRFSLPWSFLVLAGLGAAWRRREFRRPAIWFLAGLFLLSLVPEKKFRYALPLLFPMGILLGLWMGRRGDPFRDVPLWVRGVCGGHRALLVLAGLGGAAGTVWGVTQGGHPLFLAGIPAFLWLSWFSLRRAGMPLDLGTATAAAGAFSALFLMPALSEVPRLENRFRKFAEARAVIPRLPLYSLEPLNPCIAWPMDPAGVLLSAEGAPEGPFLVLLEGRHRGRLEALFRGSGRRLEVVARPVYRSKPPEEFLVIRVSRSGRKAGGGGDPPGKEGGGK